MLTLISIINKAESCLQCYQCSSNTTDELPLCDVDYWHALKENHLQEFTITCPDNEEAFCLKKIIRSSNYRFVERSCTGPFDTRGNRVMEGCLFANGDEGTVVCFCKRRFCNLASSTSVKIKNFFQLPHNYVSLMLPILILGLL